MKTVSLICSSSKLLRKIQFTAIWVRFPSKIKHNYDGLGIPTSKSTRTINLFSSSAVVCGLKILKTDRYFAASCLQLFPVCDSAEFLTRKRRLKINTYAVVHAFFSACKARRSKYTKLEIIRSIHNSLCLYGHFKQSRRELSQSGETYFVEEVVVSHRGSYNNNKCRSRRFDCLLLVFFRR